MPPVVQPGHQSVSAPTTSPSVSTARHILHHLIFLSNYVTSAATIVFVCYTIFYIVDFGITDFANDKVNLSEPSSSDWQEHTAAEGKKLVFFLVLSVVNFILSVSCFGSLSIGLL